MLKNVGLIVSNTTIPESDVLDIPSLEIVTFGGDSFARCHIALFESM